MNIPVELKSGKVQGATQPMTKPWQKGVVIGITKSDRAQSWALVMTENGEFEPYANWSAIKAHQPAKEQG